jgi:hypothetical protein
MRARSPATGCCGWTWAGAPRLVRFYEDQGFVRDGTFTVGGWHGQVLSMEA